MTKEKLIQCGISDALIKFGETFEQVAKDYVKNIVKSKTKTKK